MDLGSIDTVKGANTGCDVRICHPATGEDIGMFIRVLGKDSDEFQKISREQNRKRLQKLSKGGFRPGTVSAETIEQDGLDLLAAVTKAWGQTEKIKDEETGEEQTVTRATITLDGQELSCTKENAILVYERFPWIREQIDAAIGDRANFIKAS